MNVPKRYRVLLGIAGGIAAYKSPDLVRRLREPSPTQTGPAQIDAGSLQSATDGPVPRPVPRPDVAAGFDVRVVMTASAQSFVGPLTLQAVSGEPVHTDLLDPAAEAAMGHIELARWADFVLVAPATANTIARLAHGFADDLLSTVCLATSAPMAVAPAMNQQMWQHPATQANIATLIDRGVRVFGPGAGDQACGEVGPGRMLEPADLAQRVRDGLPTAQSAGVMQGLQVMVTAGPTREPLDPVRYLTNRSSGKMGYALAEACAQAGADVTLVSGPTQLAQPHGVARVSVETASQMHAAVMRDVARQDVFIATAAVADYRPATYQEQKIKKTAGDLAAIPLEQTQDIVRSVAALDARPFTVGFAAETERLREHAQGKLQRKNLDMIVANRVDLNDRGFGSDFNAAEVYWAGGETSLPLAGKLQLAHQLVALIAKRRNGFCATKTPR